MCLWLIQKLAKVTLGKVVSLINILKVRKVHVYFRSTEVTCLCLMYILKVLNCIQKSLRKVEGINQ